MTLVASDRIQFLETQIQKADLAYYNTGAAEVEDAVYDAWRDELATLSPDHPLLKRVGAQPSEMLAKVKHKIPMGSQDKAKNRTEFEAWVKSLPAGELIFASMKLDGGSGGFEYEAGNMVRALTRGNGVIGEDITANAVLFREFPTKGVKIGGKLFTGTIRGEIMLRNEEWKIADPDLLKNPRNCGNGIARRKEGENAELLTVYAFRAYDSNGVEICGTEAEMDAELAKAGFNVSPSVLGNSSDIWAFVEKVVQERSSLGYWIDGIVAKLNDIPKQLEMGVSDDRPNGQIAIKPPPTCTTTVLRSVELTVGHTGAIIPTGKFDPVVLAGTTVKSALLCNWNIIAALDIAVGDTVEIFKAGEIIPKVLRVTCRPANRVPIPKPNACPVCGGAVGHKKSVDDEDSAVLFCLNDDCDSKILGKVNRFTGSLNILGIGDEVLAAIVAKLGVKSPADLYTLHTKKAELESLAMGEKGVRLGAKRAAKILAEIEGKRELTLSEFLGSLGIDGLGKRRVTLIQEKVPGELDTLDDWLSGKLAGIAERAGVKNIGLRISAEIVSKKELIGRYLANGVKLKETVRQQVSADAKSFCFTGALSVPRGELAALATAKGHIVKDDVSKGLHYLVMADANSTSSKAVKARKAGTTCIDEAGFRRLIG